MQRVLSCQEEGMSYGVKVRPPAADTRFSCSGTSPAQHAPAQPTDDASAQTKDDASTQPKEGASAQPGEGLHIHLAWLTASSSDTAQQSAYTA